MPHVRLATQRERDNGATHLVLGLTKLLLCVLESARGEGGNLSPKAAVLKW